MPNVLIGARNGLSIEDNMTAIVTGSTFKYNAANYGGEISVSTDSNVTITYSTM